MVETARIRRLLLFCGLLASLVWVGNDIVAGTLWQGYSFTDQAVSELSAIGAPTRSLVVSVLLVYDVLMIAFGLGVWAHTRQRSLRLIGSLTVVIGALGFAGVPFPLQLGVTEATFTNTMHSIIAGAFGFLFLVAMGFGAFANGKRFRLFSVGTLLTLIVIGGVSAFMAGADISQHGFTAPPQWFGLIERIDIYGSMLWMAVLAIALLRVEKGQGLIGGSDAQRGAGVIEGGSASSHSKQDEKTPSFSKHSLKCDRKLFLNGVAKRRFICLELSKVTWEIWNGVKIYEPK